MTKTITLFTSIIVVILMSITVKAQVLLNEQFDYSIGDTVTSHGWNEHSNPGVNKILVTSGNLYYSHYFTSVGQSALLSSAGGQDINHTFTTQTSGSVYASILINASTVSPSTTGDYFFHFLKGTTTYAGRVYIKRDATDTTQFRLGILKGSTTANIVFSPILLSLNTTHLIVLKYKIISGTTNDSVSLFINPETTFEGSPSITASDITSADIDPGIIALRQPAASSAPNITIDGLRVANTWTDAIGYSGIVTHAVVVTGATNGITSFTANCAGNVLFDGDSIIIERGICYGTSINPDTTASKILVPGYTGIFNANLTNLNSATLYHYRAYATNGVGISYGGDSTFTTLAILPIVTISNISAITTTDASVSAEVVNDGGATILEKGICYGTSLNPSITGTKIIVTPAIIGQFLGNLTGLTSSTLYHIRAYATNIIGTGYSTDSTFTTLTATIPCTTIASLLAKPADNTTIYELTGEVVLTFKQTFKNQKWIQDSTAAIMIYDAVPATGTITTAFNIGDGITGLKGKLQNYYGLLEFIPTANPNPATSTGNIILPTVVTAADLAAADTSSLYSNQSKLIKLVGVSFSDANGVLKFGTGKKIRMTQGSTTDSLFFCNFYDADYAATTMLVPQGSGDVVGIAILSKGNYYITSRNFSEISITNTVIPTVITGTTTLITATTATCAGNVTSDGGATVSLRCICYDLTPNPTTGNYTSCTSGGAGSFTANLISLTPGTTYHYRAYATNTVGTAYGADSSFTTATLVVAPTVTTGTTSAITTIAATCAGNVTSDGGASITERGICWNTTINPITTNSKVIVSGNTGSFTGNLTGLTASTLYHYRAYAINSIGTSYGADSSFTTTTVGIKENEANKIGIYPNPNNGKFTVNVEKFNNGELRIYTMLGSLILSQEINKTNNEFDFSAYGKGIYFIQFTNSKSSKSWTEKLIIK